MRRLISLLLVSAVVLYSAPVHPEEEYDPQHTILALNMAIVSINKIVTAQDRLTLDQEYSTIINKLALGNIESDYEMTGLYAELMNFITGKGLRQEEAKRFQERYNRREQIRLLTRYRGFVHTAEICGAGWGVSQRLACRHISAISHQRRNS